MSCIILYLANSRHYLVPVPGSWDSSSVVYGELEAEAMLPRCCYQFTFETFKYLYFLNFNYFFLHLHLNWKRHTASISHLIKYLLPIMREHIGFITSNTFIIAFIKFTSKCMALKSWAKFVSSSFTWLVDVTTLEMARKPVKLQKENLAGCAGEGKQSKEI